MNHDFKICIRLLYLQLCDTELHVKLSVQRRKRVRNESDSNQAESVIASSFSRSASCSPSTLLPPLLLSSVSLHYMVHYSIIRYNSQFFMN